MPTIRSMAPFVPAAVLALSMTLTGAAQEIEEPARVVSEATGTVYLTPSHVSFWIHYAPPAGDLQQALPAAAAQETKLRTYIADRELRPAALEIYPARIDSLQDSRAVWSAQMRFTMAGLSGGATGPAKLGELCEAMKALGTALECRVSEPEFTVAETDVPVQDAVAEATKRAYTTAAGAAMALGTEIHMVERVRVQEVVWNNPPDTEARYPNIELIACTARVEVRYAVR